MRHGCSQAQMRTRGMDMTPPWMTSWPWRRSLSPKMRRGHVLGRRPRTRLCPGSALVVFIVRILMLMNNKCAPTPWPTSQTTRLVAPPPWSPGRPLMQVDPPSSAQATSDPRYKQISPPPRLVKTRQKMSRHWILCLVLGGGGDFGVLHQGPSNGG